MQALWQDLHYGARRLLEQPERNFFMQAFISTIGICLILTFGAFAKPMNPSQSAPRYDLSVQLNPEARRFDASGTVQFKTSDTEQGTFEFRLDRRIQLLKIEVVEPALSAGLVNVTLRPTGGFAVTPAKAIPPHTNVVLRFSCQAISGWAPRFYVGPESIFFSGEAFAWYPRLETFRRATGTLRFSMPTGYQVAATGLRKKGAASESSIVFNVETPTTFSFAVGRYHIYESAGTPPVALYLIKPRNNAQVQARLQLLRKIVNSLENEFGAYPHKEFEMVEVSAAAAGGVGSAYSMEGFVVSGSENFEAFNLALVAHETAHQWWADCIGPKGPRGSALLTESMAQYGALRVVERLVGFEAAQAFRRCGYPGYEMFQNRVGYLSYALTEADAPLTELSGKPFGHTLANSKGFLVHHLLAKTVGDKRFRQILRDFTRKYAFQDVSWDQFVSAVQSGAGKDLSWFFEQWYERKGVPQWQVEWQQQGEKVNLHVRQIAPHYLLTAEVVVEGQGQQRKQIIRIKGEDTVIALKMPFAVTKLRLDPGFDIPRWTPENREQAEILRPLVQATSLLQEGRAAEALRQLRAEVTPEKPLSERRFMADVFLFFVESGSRRPNEAKQHLEAALASPKRRVDLLPLLYYRQALQALNDGDQAALEESVSQAIQAEKSLVAPSGWGEAANALLR
jgi:Peptidase family M1 domain